MKKTDYDKMQRDFVLNEGQNPGIASYIQSVMETLSSVKTNTIADTRRLEIAKENLSNIKRHAKRMEEKISVLEEEIKILQEAKKVALEEGSYYNH